MTMRKTLLACSIAAALVAGCAKKETPVAQQPATTPATPAVTAAQPTATQPQPVAASEAAPGAINGRVVETMDAAGYTYIKLKTATGDVWAAVPQTKVAVGTNVTLAGNMTLDNFEAKTLERKFEHIIFGHIARPQSAPQMAAQHISGGAGHPGGIKGSKGEGAA